MIRLSGELDMATVESVRSVIEGALAAETERLVFDVSGLEFMDSSGIALLVSVARKVKAGRGPQPHPDRPPAHRADRPHRDAAHDAVRIDRSFAPDAASIRAARRFVLAAVGGAAPELRDAISVMVSELAMNAVAVRAHHVRGEHRGDRRQPAGGGDRFRRREPRGPAAPASEQPARPRPVHR